MADPPAISNYLSSPMDQDTLLKGMRILLNVFQQSDLRPYLKQRLSPSEDIDVNSDEDLMAYIRNEAARSIILQAPAALVRLSTQTWVSWASKDSR